MRCFVPATDDEIYAFIERYGIEALVPYRVGVAAARPSDLQATPVLADVPRAPALHEPRLAA